ncbi:MAG: hypothetical protein H7039_16880 [Bryobacteraceae bacterium]|nr:hypothetical protein [Bryobacteraceae bacterium]
MLQRNADFAAILVLVFAAGVWETPRIATRIAQTAMEQRLLRNRIHRNVESKVERQMMIVPSSPRLRTIHFR